MTPVSNERELLDRICHKDQLGVWADELASALALSDFLKEDWTFDDSVDLSKEIAAQLRDIIGAALTHPEFNVTEALAARQSPEPSSSEVRVHKFVATYESRDPDYTPTDHERSLIEDAICGFLSTLSPTVSQPIEAQPIHPLPMPKYDFQGNEPTPSQPVTGEEVEVVAWRWMIDDINSDPWPWEYSDNGAWAKSREERGYTVEPLVRLSDYQALKAELEGAYTYTSESATAKLEKANKDLLARLSAVEGALTPSAETKAAYIGEFAFPLEYTDDNGDSATTSVTVPWTTIKEILAAIRDRAAREALTTITGGENER